MLISIFGICFVLYLSSYPFFSIFFYLHISGTFKIHEKTHNFNWLLNCNLQ